jgi:hypothetical protein
MVFMHVSCDVLLTFVWSFNSVQLSHNHIVFSCWVSFITAVDSFVTPPQVTDDGKVAGQVLAKGDDIEDNFSPCFPT